MKPIFCSALLLFASSAFARQQVICRTPHNLQLAQTAAVQLIVQAVAQQLMADLKIQLLPQTAVLHDEVIESTTPDGSRLSIQFSYDVGAIGNEISYVDTIADKEGNIVGCEAFMGDVTLLSVKNADSGLTVDVFRDLKIPWQKMFVFPQTGVSQ